MARQKISEFRAKQILHKALDLPYEGISFSLSSDKESVFHSLNKNKVYVIKVDDGVKKRMKQGLVALRVVPKDIFSHIKEFAKKGYTHFIIEPFVAHEQSSEKYLSLEQTREGIKVLFSKYGGIDIEENPESIQEFVLPMNAEKNTVTTLAEKLSLESVLLQKVYTLFTENYFSFFEMNPLVQENDNLYFLDIAAQVDSAGEFFVNESWTPDDFRTGSTKKKSDEEIVVDTLSQKSQASFKLEMLQPDGSVFMLLSGGGASIVLADEVDNLGYGKQLANYGEYSGNPNAEEVYLYTKQLLSLLLKSKAKKKVLIIAGGVANFTDVRVTFTGVIKAIEEVGADLQEQGVKIFVRRGGPHQKEGLEQMEKSLQKNNLLGMVRDPKTSLPEIVSYAIKEISK